MTAPTPDVQWVVGPYADKLPCALCDGDHALAECITTPGQVLALAMAVVSAQAIADSDLVDHVQHGPLCPGGPSWRHAWARDLHETLMVARAPAETVAAALGAEMIDNLADRYPAITRDMVSRGSVVDWLRDQAKALRAAARGGR